MARFMFTEDNALHLIQIDERQSFVITFQTDRANFPLSYVTASKARAVVNDFKARGCRDAWLTLFPPHGENQ